MKTITKYVIYHSKEWEALILKGWVTREVVDHPIIPGWRVAVMIRR